LIDFFDTSALLKNYVRETGTQAVRAAVHARRPSVARVTHVELTATFARLCREGALDERTRDALFDRVDEDFPTFEVVEWKAAGARVARPLLARHRLRAMDVVQLASALALRARPVRFWCADGRLAAAAAAEGLRVVRPG
jgi:predicted nucleic acid-binding protein